MAEEQRPPSPPAPGQRPRPPVPTPPRRWSWVIVILVALGAATIFSSLRDRGTDLIPYSELKDHIRDGEVEEVVITSTRIEAVPKAEHAEEGVDRWAAVRVPEDEELIPLIESHEIELSAREEGNCGGGLLLIWVLPLLFLLLFWGTFLRRMGGGPGAQAMTFGKAKFKLYAEEGTGVRFSDVAGIDEVKEELQEVVDFLKEPERFYRLGGRIPKGVLLVGAPGTGKTLLARALAGEAGVPFFNLSGADFVEMFVGVGAARVRDLFEQAQKMAPCIIFIDELDAIGKTRGAGGPITGNEEREQTLNALLVEMDGFSAKQSVIILAATNRPETLDPALLRPGRFDRQIVVDRPDIRGRLEILQVHARKLVVDEDVDLQTIAAQTPGFVGAELANVVNEAALLAARRRREKVKQADFQDAIERVIAGLEKKNRRLNSREKRIVAYHESGHAIVAAALPFADPVLKVSIIPRGIGALGYTLQVPLEDRYLMTRNELHDKVAALLGGRGAERVVFGDVSTGAQNDLMRVTDIVRRMIMDYGMSETLGPVHFGDSDNNQRFLGGVFGKSRDYSDQTAQSIDAEVRAIVERIEAKVLRILEENRPVLEEMAEDLLGKEVIEGDRLNELLTRVQRLGEDEARATQNGTVEDQKPPPDGVVPEPHEPP